MAFNGSGVFQPLAAPDFPAVAGNLIEALMFNNNLQDIFDEGLTKCITRDGQSPATGNLPMGGFRHTGAGDPVSSDDYATWGKVAGLRGSIGVADWNNLTTTGLFEAVAGSLVAASTNFPNTSEVGQLIVINQGSVIAHAYLTASGTWTRRKLAGSWSDWVFFGIIISNTTLNVPGTYADINAAMTFLKDKVIAATATVTIQVADGTHNYTSTIDLSHPFGERIKLLGNTTTPANCILRVNNNNPAIDLITLQGQSKLWSIRGFKMTLSAAANGANTKSAIHVKESSEIVELDDVTVDLWPNGLLVNTGSRVTAGPQAAAFTVTNFRTYGVRVIGQSSYRDYGNTVGPINDTGLGKAGFYISDASSVYMDAPTANNCKNGIDISLGAFGFISNATCDSNAVDGIKITDGAVVFLESPSCSSNTSYGIRYSNAQRNVSNVGGSLNGTALESEAAYITNLATANPEIATTGNADLELVPGGTGNVSFGTHSAIAAETVTGYITIKDAGGTLRKLAVVS